MKKWIKRIGIVLLIPIILVITLSILLYIPPFQNFVVKKAAKYASEATGMNIGIDRIRLSFPLNLSVQGLEVITATDTLLTLEKVSVGVNPLPLLHKTVSVNSLQLQNAKVNTGSFIEGMEIKGTVGDLSAQAKSIQLTNEKATINDVSLSNTAITLRIDSISSEEDTTSTPLNWVLDLEKISLEHICFALQMPEENLRLSTYIEKAGLNNGIVDLGLSRYVAEQFKLSNSALNYDGDEKEPVAGLDPAHIALTDFNTQIENIVYQDKEINISLKEFSVKERSGLEVISLTGDVHSDSVTINIPELLLKTPNSEARLLATIPWSSLEENAQETLRVLFTASLGKEDLFIAVNDLPADFKKGFPKTPIALTAGVEGNFTALKIQQLKAELPGAFTFNASGKAGALLDSINRSADIQLQAVTKNMSFVLGYLSPEQREQFRIPAGIQLKGNASLKNREYQARMLLTEDKAKIRLEGNYHTVREAYKIGLTIDSLEPNHFMPKDSLSWLTASIQAEGEGTDIFSAATWLNLTGEIADIGYGSSTISGINISGSLKEHQAQFELKSDYPLAQMDIVFDGNIQKEQIKGMLIMDVDTLDLYGLHFMQKPLKTSFQLFAEGESNLQKDHKIDISLGNWEIAMVDQNFKSKLLTLRAHSNKDTTQASFNVGDLGITLTGNSDLETMMNKLTAFSNDVTRQLKEDSTINVATLTPLLPDMHLEIDAGSDNPIYRILRQYYMGFNEFHLDAYTSSVEGISMDAGLFSLRRDTFLLDTIRAAIRPDSLGLIYSVGVIKKKYRQQSPFTAHINGTLKYRYADAELLYTNHQNEIGLLLGVRAQQEHGAFNFQLYPEQPVIAFNKFNLNPDNFLRFRSAKDIDANIRFSGKDDASLWIHSIDEGTTYPSLHAELSQINLDVVSKGFAELPSMAGFLNLDLQYAPSDESFMVVADANIDNLIYDKERVGELMLNAVYLPLEETQHQVDVHFFRDRNEILTATALYEAGEQDKIDGLFDITTLPLNMVTPFIPDDMAALGGTLNGHMTIKGSSAKPSVDGYIQLDTSSVYIGATGSSLRLDNKKIEVKNSLINFNKYSIYAVGDNPFIIDGTINFQDLSKMTADMKLTANNMQLLDAKRTKESLVYGKLFFDLNTTIQGPLNALNARGNFHLLGGTDVAYILKESPLTVQDRLKDLVTFTSFTDTLRMRRTQPPLPLGGMDLLLTIAIDPAVQVRVDLSPDRSSYVALEGGGDLSFQYTPQGDMVLNGRYTFTGGEVKYSLPVIPLKEFSIKNDSYVQWDGEVMNPLLNITATERMRASVGLEGESSSRRVNFDVGLIVQNRLEDMSLTFTLSAPEDAAVQNIITPMSQDEVAKQAVALMATGTFLAAQGSSSFNATNVLSNFLLGEVGNIVGDAVDISLGVESSGENGQDTDFTFRFSKRFYNDRLRVTIGGKVSSGNDAQQSESFVDNASVEWRMDDAGTRYLKAFHQRNYENYFEGEITETGAGIVFRKKVQRLRELFNFKKKKIKPVTEDSEQLEKEENEKQPSTEK